MNEELLKKVRRIEISTRKIMDDLLGGTYKSHFKGQGMQFSEHRVYTPGDDIRHLDWKVTARSKEPLIKQYEEERELNVLIIADFSNSQDFGSISKSKRDLVTDLGAMLSYAASNTGDKVGALFITHTVHKIVPLKKGRNHVLRLIRDFLSVPHEAGETDLKYALEEAFHLMKHAGIIFIISDFIADGYESILQRLAKKHDVVAIHVQDQGESKIPDSMTLSIFDPETGQELAVNTGGYSFQKHWKESHEKFLSGLKLTLNRSGAELLPVKTNEDYAEILARFLRRRKRPK